MIPIKVKNKIFLLKYKVKNMINDLLTFLDVIIILDFQISCYY